MLVREMYALYSENHTKSILHSGNIKNFLMLKQMGATGIAVGIVD
jgi:hypothetical protein